MAFWLYFQLVLVTGKQLETNDTGTSASKEECIQYFLFKENASPSMPLQRSQIIESGIVRCT